MGCTAPCYFKIYLKLLVLLTLFVIKLFSVWISWWEFKNFWIIWLLVGPPPVSLKFFVKPSWIVDNIFSPTFRVAMLMSNIDFLLDEFVEKYPSIYFSHLVYPHRGSHDDRPWPWSPQAHYSLIFCLLGHQYFWGQNLTFSDLALIFNLEISFSFSIPIQFYLVYGKIWFCLSHDYVEEDRSNSSYKTLYIIFIYFSFFFCLPLSCTDFEKVCILQYIKTNTNFLYM